MAIGEESLPEVTSESAVDRELGTVVEAPVTDGDGEIVSAAPTSSPAASVPGRTATAQEWQGVLDYAKAQGVQLPYKDDQVAIRALLDAYRSSQERNYYADLGRQMSPYADQIQAFIQQNQLQAAQRAQQAQVDPFAAPEWNDQWALMVERDPSTGLIRSKPGYDPRIGEKVQAYSDWRSKWDNDPKFRDAYFERRAENKTRQMIEEKFAAYTESVQAQSIVGRNADWIFQTNADGTPLLDQQGMKLLSPAGHLYARKVDEIWKSGVRNVEQCNAMARTYVENAVMREQFLHRQGQPALQASQSQGQISPSVGGTATRHSVSPRAPRVKQEGLSLREMLNAKMNGLSDEDANQ